MHTCSDIDIRAVDRLQGLPSCSRVVLYLCPTNVLPSHTHATWYFAASATCRALRFRDVLEDIDHFDDYPSPQPISSRYSLEQCIQQCLVIKSAAAPNTEGFSPLVRARFLGYLILKAPTDEGRTNLSNEVHDCVDDAALLELASRYKLIFLRCY